MNSTKQEKATFTKYEILIITILAFIQFTVILDFMVLSPLSAILLEELNLSPAQFTRVIYAYAYSAGFAALLTAGFADKFDRKKMLLFFYVGFVFGTFLCSIAPDYHFLLIARIVTGLFGGVISSISFAIITDLFKMEVRGRVMGFVQMAFSASQILGIPVGLMLANKYGWHSPFLMIVGASAVVGIIIVIFMKPITEHLKIKSDRNPLQHLLKTISTPNYLRGFMATVLLATGGFMLMPLATAFSTKNLGINMDQLPTVYFITGIFSMVFGPLSGKLSDKIGKYNTFIIGSVLGMIMVGIYTNLGITPLWMAIVINVILFIGVSARMISASSLMTAVPLPQDRGAFMSINSAIQQLSGGIAAFCAGQIVVKMPNQPLQNYPILGYVVIGSMFITIGMMYIINKQVAKNKPVAPVKISEEITSEI